MDIMMKKYISHTLSLKRNHFRFLISGLLLFFIFTGQTSADEPERNKIRTVVIDPGHGGKDPGTLGKKTKEKEIVLGIALKLGKYIQENQKDVKVIYTRKTDVFVPLHERAEIANKNNADIFISIHANADPKWRAEGTETYAMGLHKSEDNLEIAKLENSVILLEEDYTTNYENFDPNSAESYISISLLQNIHLEQSLEFASYIQNQFRERAKRKDRGVKQAGFLVLWQTTMPSVLVETGFLSSSEEEKFLASDMGQDYIASAIYRAFRDYKNDVEKNSVFYAVKNSEPVVNGNDIRFKVQVTASRNSIPLSSEYFKGLPNVEEFLVEDMYKYAVGNSNRYKDIVEYSQTVKKYFPDAFIIALKNGRIIPVNEAIEEQKNN
jgi:N-acetylmuramoyl-L-alanine amidase